MEGLTDLQATQYERLARLRMSRRTFAECARELGVGVSTVKRWAATAEFEGFVRELREHWRTSVQSKVEDYALDALETLHELATSQMQRGHVRYEASKAILDFAYLGMKDKDEGEDDRAELEALHDLLRKRRAEREAERLEAQPAVALPPGTTVTSQTTTTITTPAATPPGGGAPPTEAWRTQERPALKAPVARGEVIEGEAREL